MTRSPAKVFRRTAMVFKPAITPCGSTSIARVIDKSISPEIGAGIEYLENTTIDWTVTYDEVLCILEGELTIELDGAPQVCTTGDMVWLPKGTRLKYIATARTGYFYSLHPVDWAFRQGLVEP